MAAKAIEPVFGSAEKIVARMVRMTAFRCGDVELPAALRIVIKNRGVIAAMKVGVCFHIKMFGKEPAAITQSYCEHVGRPGPIAGPMLKPRLQPRAQRQCQAGQKWNQHPGTHAEHENRSHLRAAS